MRHTLYRDCRLMPGREAHTNTETLSQAVPGQTLSIVATPRPDSLSSLSSIAPRGAVLIACDCVAGSAVKALCQ